MNTVSSYFDSSQCDLRSREDTRYFSSAVVGGEEQLQAKRSPHDGRLKNLCSIENETEIKDASKILVIVSLTGLVFIYE